MCAILRGALVVNEEESEEHEIGDWKSDPGYHVDRFRHSNRMRRFFFPQLQQRSSVIATRGQREDHRRRHVVYIDCLQRY